MYLPTMSQDDLQEIRMTMEGGKFYGNFQVVLVISFPCICLLLQNAQMVTLTI